MTSSLTASCDDSRRPDLFSQRRRVPFFAFRCAHGVPPAPWFQHHDTCECIVCDTPSVFFRKMAAEIDNDVSFPCVMCKSTSVMMTRDGTGDHVANLMCRPCYARALKRGLCATCGTIPPVSGLEQDCTCSHQLCTELDDFCRWSMGERCRMCRKKTMKKEGVTTYHNLCSACVDSYISNGMCGRKRCKKRTRRYYFLHSMSQVCAGQ